MATRSVLLVDDDALIRESLAEVLGDLSCQVHSSSCGLDAWQCYQDRASDLVISDVDMPDISGFELLSRIQQTKHVAPVMLMSARADQLKNQARQAGARCILAKPVALDLFTTQVTSILSDLPPS